MREQKYVGRKMMEMKLLKKRKRGRPKRKIFRCCERRYGEVDVKEMDVEDRTVWRRMIRCGYP